MAASPNPALEPNMTGLGQHGGQLIDARRNDGGIDLQWPQPPGVLGLAGCGSRVMTAKAVPSASVGAHFT